MRIIVSTFVGIIFIFLNLIIGSVAKSDASRSGDGNSVNSHVVRSYEHKLRSYTSGKSLHKRAVSGMSNSPECPDIFDGDDPGAKIKKCVNDERNKSRCGSIGDGPCLCDSIFFREGVKNCSESDFEIFFNYFQIFCNRSLAPPPSCTNISNPLFPTVFSDDPFKKFEIGNGTRQCLRDAANNSLCHRLVDVSCLCDSRTFRFFLSECKTNFSSEAEEIDKGFKNLCNLTSLEVHELEDGRSLHKRAVSRAPNSPDCPDLFDGEDPGPKTRDCIEKGRSKSRCGSIGDGPCLCDSLFVRSTIMNCSRDDFGLFFQYFEDFCNKSLLPEPTCLNIPNPSFPTILCDDPFEHFEVGERTLQCLKDALNGSLCHNHKDVSCMCDSRTFSYDLRDCNKKFPHDIEKIKEGLKRLCNKPLSAGLKCRVKGGRRVSNDASYDHGAGSKAAILKKLLLAMIGITIPITLGLIN